MVGFIIAGFGFLGGIILYGMSVLVDRACPALSPPYMRA